MDTTTATEFQTTLDSIINLVHGIGATVLIALIVGVLAMVARAVHHAPNRRRSRR